MKTITTVLVVFMCYVVNFGQNILPPVSSSITATPYDSHCALVWNPVKNAVNYAVFSDYLANGESESLGRTHANYFLHFPQGKNTSYLYHVEAFDQNGNMIWESPQVRGGTKNASDDELLDMVQQYTLRYFWDFAHPSSGMAYERSNGAPAEGKVTIGGSGMGVMALLSGVERGFISRENAYDRILRIVGFLEKAPRFKGMWAHWYNGDTGTVMSFSEKDNGGDVVESAFMMQGLLCARQFFSSAKELSLRQRITRLWEDMDWDFYTQGQNVIYWHYSPDYGFEMNHPIRGYNEALIVYILAAASPTHPIRADVYNQGWASWDQKEFSNYSVYYNMMLPLGNQRWLGGPLFFAHYSYLGLCPKGLRDRYADYWQQNVRQVLINRAYCMDNPYNWVGYGAGFWGITACDMVPEGYMAHMPGYWFDTGTVAPTAALSSMPYTPEFSMDVLKNLYRNYGKECFGGFGFYDAINFSVGDMPVKKNYIAIDQAPIMVMIENYRTGLLWRLFMQDNDVRKGLSSLDFKIDNAPVSFSSQKN
ncbi:MAG: glucoamylase family protein [Flavobacteriales bacterium]|nr:glucoamylase family protein [Flavobacteriales bacterium]